jgi:ABC-2 type transport system permease protein
VIIDAEPGLVRTVATAVSRIGTMCLVELQKLRHDRTELLTRAVQPALWLVVFGNVFTQHTGDTLAEKGDMRDVRAARRTAGRLG